MCEDGAMGIGPGFSPSVAEATALVHPQGMGASEGAKELGEQGLPCRMATGETNEIGAGSDLGMMLTRLLSPVLDAMGRMMRLNAEALDRMAATQKVMGDQVAALEKQVRLNTPVTPTQVRHCNDAIRRRARELLAKRELADDAKAVKALGGMIRKAVLARYGVGALHEVPKHEYSVALSLVATWNDALAVRDVVKKVRDEKGDTGQ